VLRVSCELVIPSANKKSRKLQKCTDGKEFHKLTTILVKYEYFTEIVVNLWNFLPSKHHCFQVGLDKFWSDRDGLDSFKATFSGNGSRSYSQNNCLVYYIMYTNVGTEAMPAPM